MAFIDEVRNISISVQETKKLLEKTQARHTWETVVKPAILRAAECGDTCICAPIDEELDLKNPNAPMNLWYRYSQGINAIAVEEGFRVNDHDTIFW